MPPKTIAKIVFLVLMSISALIAIAMGFIIKGKNRGKVDVAQARLILKIRMICFVVMLIFLFICIII